MKKFTPRHIQMDMRYIEGLLVTLITTTGKENILRWTSKHHLMYFQQRSYLEGYGIVTVVLPARFACRK